MPTAAEECSRKQALHNACRHRPSQLLIETLELVGQLVVVDAKAMQNGRVKVPNRDWIPDDVVTVLIGLSIGDSSTNAASGHPCCKAARMMIATVVFRGQATLAIDSAT